MSSIDMLPPQLSTLAAAPSPDRAFVYAPSPMLLFDATGRLMDLNVACRELMGVDIAGCKGRSCAYVTARLAAVVEGDVLPTSGMLRKRLTLGAATRDTTLDAVTLGVAVARWRYRSPRFGWATLHVAELPRLDVATGECTGSLVNLEVLTLEHLEAFQAARERGWAQGVMWEVYASSYDRILPELSFYQDVVERHRAAMMAPGIERVLDLGAGTGNVTIPLARAGKQVTAIDLNHAMLDRLSSKLAPAERARVTLVEDTAERLPHAESASFDGVTAMLALFAMEEPASAVREAERILRPGGTLIVTEPKRCFNVTALMAEAERLLDDKGLISRLHGDWVRIQRVAPHIKSTIDHVQARDPENGDARWDAETLLEWVRDRGFRELRFEDAHLGNCATISGVKPG